MFTKKKKKEKDLKKKNNLKLLHMLIIKIDVVSRNNLIKFI